MTEMVIDAFMCRSQPADKRVSQYPLYLFWTDVDESGSGTSICIDEDMWHDHGGFILDTDSKAVPIRITISVRDTKEDDDDEDETEQ